MARDLAEVVDFGRYEPLFRIGLGGMAEVYAARIRGEAGFQKLVAVKRMLPHLTGDQKFVDMFLDEARLAANISSPHVVQTLDLGRADDDSLYIVMNLILGVTISQALRASAEKKEYFDPGVALELIRQAAQGLDDAHEALSPAGEPLSIVHRDISPQNILIGVDGRARVTDFGIAHAIMLRRTETQVGEMKGKFAYFSPEQAMGRPLDRRSDVFALGIVGWELLTGRRLFRGTPLEQLEAVKQCQVPDAKALRPDLPKPLSDAIMMALQKDPDDRYASAAAFAASLRKAGAAMDDVPGPRAIGQLVNEIGGERLTRMRQCIANSGRLPADVPKVTAIIEGTISGTHLIGEASVATHLLDETSKVHSTQGVPAAREKGAAATKKQGLPSGGAEAFASSVTTNEIPENEDLALHPAGPAIASLPTRIEAVAEQPTMTIPDEASLTVQTPPTDVSLHQAATHHWMAEPVAPRGADHGPKPRVLAIAAGVLLSALLGVLITVVAMSGDDPEVPLDGDTSSFATDPPGLAASPNAEATAGRASEGEGAETAEAATEPSGDVTEAATAAAEPGGTLDGEGVNGEANEGVPSDTTDDTTQETEQTAEAASPMRTRTHRRRPPRMTRNARMDSTPAMAETTAPAMTRMVTGLRSYD